MTTIRDDILELASKLNEGDYLKIANILKTANEPPQGNFYKVVYLKPLIHIEDDDGSRLACINFAKKTKILQLTDELYMAILENGYMGYMDDRNIFRREQEMMDDKTKIQEVHRKDTDDEETVLDESDNTCYVMPVVSIRKI